ncbi:MAG: hypothetical protein ACRD8O_16790, partial [Bryobacteraceae bacterium]
MTIRSFAGLVAYAALMAPTARSQTAQPDLNLTDYVSLSGPTPNGRIRATFQYTGSNVGTTADAVVYRGSVALGGATEILRQPLTFVPGAFSSLDTGNTIPFNEGDVFSVCINPNRTVAESNYNNNCQERVVSAAYTDLAISVADISMTPVGPSVGQPVTVTARVRNKYNTAARTLVRLFQSQPYSPGSKLLGQNTINVPGNGSAVASFTVTRPAGDSNFWVKLEDTYPRDVGSTDDLTSRNVYLKAIINTGRTAPGTTVPVPYAGTPAIGDLLGTGQPVMVFPEYVNAATVNAEARMTALQLFSDGTFKELWSKSGFLATRAHAMPPALADIDGDGQPEIVFEVVHYNPDSAGGQIGVVVLNKDGSLKWQHVWNTVGRVPCRSYVDDSRPAIGDMNGDRIADIVVLESEFVVLDGKNGNELVRKPGIRNTCSSRAYSAIADVDGDGKNEYIVGDFGIHVFNNDGTLRWENTTYGNDAFALLDTDKDGKPEIVLPIFRSGFIILDAVTGQLKAQKKPSPDWGAWSWTIAATTSVDPNNFPSLAIANNDYKNGTGLLDNNLNLKWYDLVPPMKLGNLDNPSYVVLADLLGQGRPQVI